jgi:hypothetical protein
MKQTRRCLALLLCALLALALFCPASAVYDDDSAYDGDYPEVYKSAYAEGYALGQADFAVDFVSGRRDEANSPEWPDKLWDNGTREEIAHFHGLIGGYYDGYTDAYDAAFGAEYQAGYDEGYALGLADGADDAANDDYDKREHFPGWGMDYSLLNAAEARQKGAQEGYFDGYYEAYYAAERAAVKAEQAKILQSLGGAPGEINVRLNDRCVPFPDAFPFAENGSTLVPVRAIMESLGAAVVYDANTKQVTLAKEDTTIVLTLDSKEVTVTRGGVTETQELPAAAAARANRTYVPLRFISETLGYDVLWDPAFYAVVILDRETLTADMDGRFSAVNAWLAEDLRRLEAPHISRADGKLDSEVFDSISGNEKASVTSSLTLHTGKGTFALDGSIDFSGILKLSAVQAFLEEVTDERTRENVLSALGQKQPFHAKYTADGGCYVSSPLLPVLYGSLYGTSGRGGEDTWYYLGSQGDAEALLPQVTGIGALLYENARTEAESATAWHTGAYGDTAQLPRTNFFLYETLQKNAAAWEVLAGDAAAQTKGTTQTWHMDGDTVQRFFTLLGEDFSPLETRFAEMFPVFDIVLSRLGGEAFTGTGNIIASEYPGFQLTWTADGNGKGGRWALTFKLKNIVSAALSAQSTYETTAKEPDLTLPGKDKIIDLSDDTAIMPDYYNIYRNGLKQ